MVEASFRLPFYLSPVAINRENFYRCIIQKGPPSAVNKEILALAAPRHFQMQLPYMELGWE